MFFCAYFPNRNTAQKTMLLGVGISNGELKKMEINKKKTVVRRWEESDG